MMQPGAKLHRFDGISGEGFSEGDKGISSDKILFVPYKLNDYAL